MEGSPLTLFARDATGKRCNPNRGRACRVSMTPTRCALRTPASLSLLLALASSGATAVQTPAPASVVVRLGGYEGPAAEVFSRVEALEIDVAAGLLYVLDGGAHELRAFGLDGVHRWSFGAEGDGPGEFRYPVGLARRESGSIWVIDPEAQRATVVDAAGRLSATRTLPSGIALSPWPGRFDAAGRLYSYREADATAYGIEMVRYGEDLRPDIVLSPPPAPRDEEFYEGRDKRGSHLRARVPFTPRVVWRLDSAGRFVWGWTGDPRIFVSEGSRPRELASFDATAPPVTRADRETALESLARFEELGGRVDAARIPDRMPAFHTFVLGEDDGVWVVPTAQPEESATRILRLETSGSPGRAVDLPFRLAAVPIPVVRRNYLLGLARDDLGIEEVFLVRLP